MNERIHKIISLLLKEPNIRISEMMRELSLTRRQINYAISLINEELRAKHIPEIVRHKNGTFSYNDAISLLIRKDRVNSSDELSDHDREILILVYLILKTDYVSLAHLTTFLEYSKTTISNDIRDASKIATKYELKINYNRVQGYSLVGKKDNIYRLANFLFFDNTKLITDDLILKITKNKTIAKQATVLIMDIEDKFKATFSDTYFMALKFIIQCILYRGQKISNRSSEKNDPLISKTNEYKFLKKYPGLNKLDSSDIKWLSLEILAANVYDKSNFEYGPDEKIIFNFTHQLVEGFKKRTLVEIDNQSKFEKRLMNHLRPACYRVKYHLPSIGSIEITDGENHQILFKIIKDLIKPLEKWIGTPFPKSEIQLLTYYFGYQLISTPNVSINKKPKYKAVVVCSNGIIMSNILIRTLQKLFPEINFLFTMSMREFENSNKNIDVVFTTLPLNTNKPQYIVKPDMTYSEKIGLRYRVLKQLGLEKTDSQVNELIELISHYANIKNNRELKRGIEKVLLTSDQLNTKKENSYDLLYYIQPDYIVLNNDKEISWQKALHLALNPLVKDGKVESRYEQELKNQIDSPYNYSFLGSKVSIPHALPKTGILNDGIGFFVSKYPIKLPYNKKANIIAPIAFYHLDSYLKAINQFASLATNQNYISQIINCNTSKKVYKTIEKFIQNRG